MEIIPGQDVDHTCRITPILTSYGVQLQSLSDRPADLGEPDALCAIRAGIGVRGRDAQYVRAWSGIFSNLSEHWLNSLINHSITSVV